VEVPYWRILLQFYEDDEENSGDYRDEPESFEPQKKQSCKYENGGTLKCRQCNSDVKFCALDDSTEFYCSKSCMNNYLQETEPLYFDLDSEILKINARAECSIRTVDLDYALQVAGDRMPNLKAVDIYIDQNYLLEGMDNLGKSVLLSSTVLKHFLESMSERLVSFSFRLDDCCWEEIKGMTDRCRALAPLGTMPNLKKLNLSSFGFDDVPTLILCLSPSLQNLHLDYIMMGREALEWNNFKVDALVNKLSQLKRLVSLSLADSALTDNHLRLLLPRLKHIRCLTLEGNFGGEGDSPLTDLGLKVIADHCPNLLSLSVDYQGKLTISGIMLILQKCPKLIELSALTTKIGVQHFKNIMTSTDNLLSFAFGMYQDEFSNRERSTIQKAVAATNGRVVICTMKGLFKVNLSLEHKRNQDDSMAKIERAHEQQFDPMVINKWNGIL